MNCPKCATPLNPMQKFCTKCGAAVPTGPAEAKPSAPEAPTAPPPAKVKPTPAKEKRPKPIAVGGKRSPVKLILAILLLLVSAAGFVYSFTDNAKIVGKWNFSIANVSQVYEYDVFGGVKTNIDGIDISGTYKLSGNQLIQSVAGVESVREYSFTNGNKELRDTSTDEFLTRADALPFYIIVMISSGVIALIGIILLVFGLKKKKGAITPLTPIGERPAAPAPAPARPAAPTPAPAPAPARPAAPTPAPAPAPARPAAPTPAPARPVAPAPAPARPVAPAPAPATPVYPGTPVPPVRVATPAPVAPIRVATPAPVAPVRVATPVYPGTPVPPGAPVYPGAPAYPGTPAPSAPVPPSRPHLTSTMKKSSSKPSVSAEAAEFFQQGGDL